MNPFVALPGTALAILIASCTTKLRSEAPQRSAPSEQGEESSADNPPDASSQRPLSSRSRHSRASTLAFENATPHESKGTRRVDVIVDGDGLATAFAEAGLPRGVLERLDEELLDRVDLYAVATRGRTISVWLCEEELVAFSLIVSSGERLTAASYDGPLAPRGLYDARGFSLDGPLRARPVALSHVTSKFGDRFDPLTGRASSHRGVDYAVPIGTTVFAIGDGIVRARGTSKTGGRFIEIAHASGFVSKVMHLSSFAASTEVGARVSKNDVIGKSGNTGRSTGPHVHYELLLAGEALDPARTAPLPLARLGATSKVALGPLALREHRAHLENLLKMEANDDNE